MNEENQKKAPEQSEKAKKTNFFSFLQKKKKDTTQKESKPENTTNGKESTKTQPESSDSNNTTQKKPNAQIQSAKNLLTGLFQKNTTQKTPQNDQNKQEKNLFVDLFPQEKEQKADTLIETIVEQSDQKKQQSILGQKLHNRKTETPKSNTQTALPQKNEYLFLSYFAIALAIVLPLTIYLFFYFHTTPSSSILKSFGIKNIGEIYAAEKEHKLDLEKSIKTIENNLANLEKNSPQMQMEETIKQIKNDANDWLLVMDYIQKVTNQGVRYNDLLDRVKYNSYSFQKTDNIINLSAEISDPNKEVFALATSLIEAINDSIYFSGMENRNFSKSISEEGAKMSLSLKFNYIPENQRETPASVISEEKKEVLSNVTK